jgi:hypothetical protein
MTSENVSKSEAVAPTKAVSAKAVDDQLIDELVGRAQAEGLQLTGEGGLLQQLTKRLLESALEGEITDHLGYDKHDPPGSQGPRTLPQRAGRVEMRLHGNHVARSHRQGPGPLDHALEERTERLRHHLRWPPLSGPSVTPTTPVTPLI